jgi:MFS family permease
VKFLDRIAIRDWRWLAVLFFTSTLLEGITIGHIDAFTPLILRDLLFLSPEDVRVWTGILTALTFAISFPLTPFWASLAERYGRKPFIVRSQYLECVACLIMAFSPDMNWLIVGRVVLGLTYGNIALVTAVQSLVTPQNRVGSAISWTQAAGPLGWSIGPALGALLIPQISLHGLLLFDAACALTAGILVSLFMPEPERTGPRRTVLGNIANAANLVWTNPALRFNFICWYLGNGSMSVIRSYLPVRIAELEGANAANAIGFILGGFGLVSVGCSWLTGRMVDRFGAIRVYWPMMAAAAACTVGIALAPWLWLVTVFAWLRAVPQAMNNVALYTHLTRSVDRADLATVMGFTPFPRNIAAFSLPLIASLFAVFGTGGALLWAAATYAMAAGVGYQISRASAAEEKSSGEA